MSAFDALYHASALFILILGIFIAADNYKQRNSWIFFFWALSASIWMLGLYWGFWFAAHSYFGATLMSFRVAFATSISLMSLMTVFFYYFPRVTVKVPYWLRFLYVAFTAFLVIAALTPLIHDSLVIEDGVYTADVLGAAYPLYTFDIVLNFFAALYLAIRKFLGSAGIERNKIAVSTFGYFIFVFFAVLTNVVLPFFGIMILWLQELVPILTLFFVIPAFISLQRYRFFNLSYVSLNFCRRLIFYAIFLFLAWGTFHLLISIWPTLNSIVAAGTGILVALYLLEKLEQRIPRFYSEDLKNFLNSLSELKTVIFSCDTLASLQKALDGTFSVKLNFTNTKLYVIRSKKGKLEVPIYIKNEFTSELSKYQKDLLVLDEIKYQKKSQGNKRILERAMKELEADVCVPLFSENNLIGLLALKKKEENRVYPKEEINEIMDMKRGLEIALMNILLKLNLEEENNLMKSIIQKKTKELKRKIEKINELLKQQSDFIAVTAHEFRTPLSIAMFQLDEVMDSKRPKKDLLEDLQVIDQSLENLKMLTQKLFTVQQYDLNKVEVKKEKTSIRSLIKGIYSEFTLIMKEKDIDFTLSIPEKSPMNVMVDRAQLRQALHNILNNAFKFATAGGKVSIEVLTTDKFITLKIEDSGDGIPDDLKKCIFEKFRTKSAGAGIGLGLYLCKKIMELHKGKVWVEDSSLGGASFCIQLKRVK
jgi:signal transduction histidine kinase